MPSQILSKYISGTMGDSHLSKKPTCGSLYMRIPIFSPLTKNIAPAKKPKMQVIFMTLETADATTPRLPRAIASDISGISRVDTALRSVDGKKRMGSAIPFIIPKVDRASAPENAYFARFLGTSMFSAVRNREFKYLPAVMGRAIRAISFETP